MKRISTFVALLVFLCSTTQAWDSQSYRVHYNPYAFSYHNCGLVSGGVRYSIYAFGYHHSGLIQEYQMGGIVPGRPWTACSAPLERITVGSRCVSPSRRSVSNRRCSVSAQELREMEENDGLNVIRQYLIAQGYKDIYIKDQLSIENQTVGAAIILGDSNLVITYTNGKALAALARETGYKKHAVERLKQGLAEASEAMVAKGGQVYAIDKSDRNQILVALQDCAALRTNTPGPTAMYAKD